MFAEGQHNYDSIDYVPDWNSSDIGTERCTCQCQVAPPALILTDCEEQNASQQTGSAETSVIDSRPQHLGPERVTADGYQTHHYRSTGTQAMKNCGSTRVRDRKMADCRERLTDQQTNDSVTP